MDSTKDLSGLIIPILTPFHSDGSIDEQAFIGHIGYLAENGIERILVNGTTGEFFSLTYEERKRLFQIARKHFDGTLIYQAGSDGLAQTCIAAKWAVDNGADAIMALGPYYLAGVPALGIVEYFNILADAVDVPLILYNFPKHTQNPLTPDILAGIKHFGIKDSSADLSLIASTPHYYVGGDDKILPAHKQGAFGFVSARANAFAPIFAEMEKALKQADITTATAIQERVSNIKKSMSGSNGIAMIKYALSKSIPSYPQHMRPPLITLPDEQKQRLDEQLQHG